jgi:hypothetical protein
MKTKDRQLTELEALVEQTASGADMSAADVARLEELLLADKAARTYYIESMMLHGMLNWKYEVPEPAEFDSEPVMTCSLVTAEPPRKFSRQLLAAAAAVLILFGLMLMAPDAPNTVDVAKAPTVDEPQDTVAAVESVVTFARVTHADAARFVGADYEVGEWLPATTLVLESGVVEVTFDSGAKIILEGPAEFDIETSMRGFLHSGKMTAEVPEPAIGFTINTPTSNVLDLGTRFGLAVDDEGKTDVHVLEGAVEAVAGESGDPVVLAQDQAVRFDLGQNFGPQTIAFDSSQFIDSLPESEWQGPINYVYWPFDQQTGNVAADLGYRGAAGVSYPGRLKPLRQADIRDRRWVEGRFGNALSFDGETEWMRTNYRGVGGDSPRTVAFWIKIPEKAKYHDAFTVIAWGVPNSKAASWEVSWNRNAKQGKYGAVRTSYGKGYVVGSKDLRDGKWHHVASVFTGARNADVSTHIRHYVDGKLQDVTGSAGEQIDTAIRHNRSKTTVLGRKLGDGKQKFKGVLDEVYVFETALTPSQIYNLYRYNRLNLDLSL